MQRTYNLFAGFFLAMLLLMGAGCASTPQQESTGEILDDSVITTKVKSAILGDANLKFFEINVATARGVVELSGTVSSKDAVDKATQVTRGVAGVKSVKNDLQVK